jgi:hypothetical protein
MNKLIKCVLGLDKKTMYIIQLAFTIIMLFVNYITTRKFEIGYQFSLSFISIIPIDILMILLMIRIQKEVENTSTRSIYLIKFFANLMILVFVIAPFLYLWSMSDVIKHLKW